MVVRLARGAEELERALDLRRRVFADEQGVRPEADRDGRDPEAMQFVALDGGVLVGTCRILIEGRTAKLGRMVVAAGDRRRGIGRAVLEEAERSAHEAGATRVLLNAQLPARDFYARGGYESRGATFVEEGIEHVAMEKRLA